MTLNTVDPSGFTIRGNTNKTYSSEITHQIDSAVTQFLHMQHANQSYAEVEANVEYYAYLKLQAKFHKRDPKWEILGYYNEKYFQISFSPYYTYSEPNERVDNSLICYWIRFKSSSEVKYWYEIPLIQIFEKNRIILLFNKKVQTWLYYWLRTKPTKLFVEWLKPLIFSIL